MRFDYSVTIRRSPSAVFAMLADVQDWGKAERAALVPVMEKITPGPTRVGTRWHEVIQLAPHLTMTVWSEVVAIEQDRLLDERFWAWWMRGRLEYTMVPTDGGTVLRQRERLEPRGPFRPIDGLIARQLGPAIAARLNAIGRMLEAAGRQQADAARARDRPAGGRATPALPPHAPPDRGAIDPGNARTAPQEVAGGSRARVRCPPPEPATRA